MVTESPPVSPSVVAAILMIQKTRVTSGTLVANLSEGDVILSVVPCAPRPLVSAAGLSQPGRLPYNFVRFRLRPFIMDANSETQTAPIRMDPARLYRRVPLLPHQLLDRITA